MHPTVTAAFFSLALAVFWLGSGAFAHEGEDHGMAEVARPQAAASPRAEAASDQFELVAAARRGELTIFLDRFATNAPVANAKITVETPSGSVDAVAAADETYRLPAPWSRAPGRYDLIVTVVADGAADVLPLTLTARGKQAVARTGKTVAVLFQERGRREGQLIGKSPWLQSVHAQAPERLIGRLVEVRVTGGHANSLAGEVVTDFGVAA